MKRISLEKLEAQYKTDSYQMLYRKVMELLETEKIKPVKASGINGKKPALYKEYWIIEKAEDNSSYIEELSYLYVPVISTDYYLNHIQQYQEDREWLLLLNHYFKTRQNELKIPQSMNERSFAVWNREKFLKEEEGKKILKRCKISLETLNLYETTEPLAYYVHTRRTPQNLLIIENKDTFYSMRKHLMSGENEILGLPVGTLIYGAGKGILKSFLDFTLCGEPYMSEKENKIYYFGDLDYEGIGIYEKLAEISKPDYEILPFCRAYEKMNEKAKEAGIENMPEMKTGQNRNIGTKFWEYFEEKEVRKMQKLLDQGQYLPQEILSGMDF